jgi:hypothetical protein
MRITNIRTTPLPRQSMGLFHHRTGFLPVASGRVVLAP